MELGWLFISASFPCKLEALLLPPFAYRQQVGHQELLTVRWNGLADRMHKLALMGFFFHSRTPGLPSRTLSSFPFSFIPCKCGSVSTAPGAYLLKRRQNTVIRLLWGPRTFATVAFGLWPCFLMAALNLIGGLLMAKTLIVHSFIHIGARWVCAFVPPAGGSRAIFLL